MFSSDIRDGIFILRLSGDVTVMSEGESMMFLAQDALKNGVLIGVVDIAEVRFMDSSGIGLLIRLRHRFTAQGGEVYLLKPPDLVRRLLAMTRLEAIFTVINSVEEVAERGGKS